MAVGACVASIVLLFFDTRKVFEQSPAVLLVTCSSSTVLNHLGAPQLLSTQPESFLALGLAW